MKRAVLLATFAFSVVAVCAQDCWQYIPGKCPQVDVVNGSDLRPPVFIPTGGEPEWTVRMQVEIWQDLGGGRQRLFARVWADETSFAEVPCWGGYVLLGSGPFGFRLFPVGNYMVQIRAWNPLGFGPWSDPTYFSVQASVPPPAPTLTDAPSTNAANSDVHLAWRTDFVASQFQIEILRGTRIMRRVTQGQTWQWRDGSQCDPPLDGSYVDAPAMPSQELPEGGGYVCRIRAYSPCARQWSPWAQTGPFEIAYDPPSPPPPFMVQEDFLGAFDLSPRPYFGVEENVVATGAKWYQFEVWRYDSFGRLKKVLQHWTRGTEIGGGTPSYSAARPFWWKNDLPAGNYRWRVLAWNGPAPHQQARSDWMEDSILPAGPLAPPDVSEAAIWWSTLDRRQALAWGATRNAYSYQVEFQRNGLPFRTTPWLDTATGALFIRSPFEDEMFYADDVIVTPTADPLAYNVATTASTFTAVGVAQGWHGDDDCWQVALPFAFPFFGVNRTKIYINSNGTITFDEWFAGCRPSMDSFKSRAMIAPLWDDLLISTPGDIYLASSTNRVIVRWSGCYAASGTPVNFSLTLYRNGTFEAKYGAGNDRGGFVGVSAGDGVHFLLPPCFVNWDYKVPRLPDGVYRFRVRARNTTNPPAQQISPWSEWTEEITINTALPTIVWLDEHVSGHDVTFEGEASPGDLPCEVQIEVVQQECPGYHLFTSETELTLPPGNYRWRARLRNAWHGWGPWSWWEQFTVPAPP